ncbi:MAG: EMC3/TMCO1 family protein [Thermoplasmata archaeon]|nr:EMC3/TMCO1 family protein [Thermoplasmata archaeon]MCI4354862.1 EMC3/TMCO1 family protein [Thermoplasmata archaeon]
MSGEALPSSSTEAAPSEDESDDTETTETPSTPAGPPRPQFKFSTFLLTFLFLMGILMLVQTSLREGVANGLNTFLLPSIGFSYSYPLLTMFLAAVLEMLITAIAYNVTTDWVKAAKVQKWNAAFNKVKMEALRSGKKDRIDALKPHQQKITALSGEVSIGQLKGMAVTWFLVIAIYTWVGLFIRAAYLRSTDTLTIGGGSVHLYLGAGGLAFLPLWFLVFSLYTIPSSLAFRRVLKHYWLQRYAAARPPGLGPVGGGA